MLSGAPGSASPRARRGPAEERFPALGVRDACEAGFEGLAVLPSARSSDLCHGPRKNRACVFPLGARLGRAGDGGNGVRMWKEVETVASKGLVHWPANLDVHKASLQQRAGACLSWSHQNGQRLPMEEPGAQRKQPAEKGAFVVSGGTASGPEGGCQRCVAKEVASRCCSQVAPALLPWGFRGFM